MTSVNTTTPATVGEQGAHLAPAKAASKKQVPAHKSAPKAQKAAKAAKPKKVARKPAQAPKPQAGPRTGSKSAKVLGQKSANHGVSVAYSAAIEEL